MMHRLTVLFSKLPLLGLVFFLLPSCDSPVRPSAPEKNHRAILYFDTEGELRMDYEGTGLLQRSTRVGDSVEFKAMHLNRLTDQDIHSEKWVDAAFDGTVRTSGDDDRDVEIRLKVRNKVPFEIQTMGIVRADSPGPDAPDLHQFPPGTHELNMQGKIEGYYRKE